MTDKLKERLEMLSSKISPWPWEVVEYTDGDSLFALERVDGDGDPEFIGEIKTKNYVDSKFIATAPQFESELIAEVLKLREENEELENQKSIDKIHYMGIANDCSVIASKIEKKLEIATEALAEVIDSNVIAQEALKQIEEL
jgi:hypothetical protein